MLASLRGISKSFGSVRALSAASLELAAAEVHILAGENGAGKTSLMNVLAGVYRPDAGEIEVDGALVDIASPRDALSHGIAMVHQHFQLVPTLSALDNILLGSGAPGVFLRRERRRREVAELAAGYGLELDLDEPVGRLPIGLQQKVEVLRALDRRVKILILDEPTTHLTPQEVDSLFPVVRRLAEQGTCVVMITHKVGEMLAIGDRFTVMRQGGVVGDFDRADASRDRIVRLLMGDQLERPPGPERPAAGRDTPLLELEAEGLSLQVGPGELLGVAGVAGNGQRELAEMIMALSDRPARVRIAGREIRPTVAARIQAGIAYVPEDRLREGVLPRLPLAESFYLGLHQVARGWRLDHDLMGRLTATAIADYRVAAGGGTAAAATLSGGNMQKLLVARAVELAETRPQALLLAMNPVRGLDVATTALVHAKLLQLRAAGRAVLLISEDLDELVALADRIAVLYRGRIAATFERSAFDTYRIGAAMTGAGLE